MNHAVNVWTCRNVFQHQLDFGELLCADLELLSMQQFDALMASSADVCHRRLSAEF